MQKTVSLPYGTGEISVSLPASQLMGVYSPIDVPPVADVQAEIIRALSSPIGTQPLRALARGKRNVVMVADDNTRLTPADIILPVLLNECNAGGVPDEHITVIIALGTHRFMTQDEILAKFGREVVRRVKIKNHPYKGPDSLIDLGVTANGTKVMINREVYEADFKIGIGSIVPHHIPGYAGGAKIVQPGISGEKTTAETHLLSVKAPRSLLGIVDNPVRRELDDIAQRIGFHTIFNTVLNRHGQVVAGFYGDVVEAFRKGVEKARQVYAVEMPQEADIVLAGSHPCDLEFWQAHKTLYAADRAVREGGILIVVTPCYEGVAKTHTDMVDFAGLTPDEVREKMRRGEIHDEVAAALAIAWGQVRQRAKVYFVSQGVTPAEARKLSFEPFDAAQDALNKALSIMGPAAKVAVLTHAPDMLPVIKG